MDVFKNILYFADGNLKENPALDRAIALAARSNAQLTLVDVIPPQTSSDYLNNRFNVDINERLQQLHRQNLRALVSDQSKHEPSIEIIVISGAGFIEVIREVLSNNYDLLIKPAQYGCNKHLSSGDMHLLRKCPCPVWIDRSPTHQPYRMVVAAVDPTSNHDDDCADQALQLAWHVAEADQAELGLLHAWQLYGESMLSSGLLRVGEAELEMLLDEARLEHESALFELMQRQQLSTSQVSVHLQKGKPAEVINQLSQQLRADLIVMGTVGRTGIPGFIIGNTAEEVLQNSCCSILAVKPTGFVSPVKPAANA